MAFHAEELQNRARGPRRGGRARRAAPRCWRPRTLRRARRNPPRPACGSSPARRRRCAWPCCANRTAPGRPSLRFRRLPRWVICPVAIALSSVPCARFVPGPANLCLVADLTKQAAIMLMTGHTPRAKLTGSPRGGGRIPSLVVTKPGPLARPTPLGRELSPGRTPKQAAISASPGASRRSSRRTAVGQSVTNSLDVLKVSSL